MQSWMPMLRSGAQSVQSMENGRKIPAGDGLLVLRPVPARTYSINDGSQVTVSGM